VRGTCVFIVLMARTRNGFFFFLNKRSEVGTYITNDGGGVNPRAVPNPFVSNNTTKHLGESTVLRGLKIK
jgi:hypothetical protein